MRRRNVKRKILTPQEKKSISYVKDTRNSYGEAGARSRFSIARNKVDENQALRHGQNLVLKQILKVTKEEIEIVEAKMKSVEPRRWRKWADNPLGERISGKLEGKEEEGGENIELKRFRILQMAKKRWKPKTRYSRWVVKSV